MREAAIILVSCGAQLMDNVIMTWVNISLRPSRELMSQTATSNG